MRLPVVVLLISYTQSICQQAEWLAEYYQTDITYKQDN